MRMKKKTKKWIIKKAKKSIQTHCEGKNDKFTFKEFICNLK